MCKIKGEGFWRPKRFATLGGRSLKKSVQKVPERKKKNEKNSGEGRELDRESLKLVGEKVSSKEETRTPLKSIRRQGRKISR